MNHQTKPPDMHFIGSSYLKILLFGGILFLGTSSKATIPILEVVQEGPDISLVWNDTGENWTLETSPDLGLSTQWELADQPPVLADGFFSVPVQVVAHRQYFRLRFQEGDPTGFASIPGGTFTMEDSPKEYEKCGQQKIQAMTPAVTAMG